MLNLNFLDDAGVLKQCSMNVFEVRRQDQGVKLARRGDTFAVLEVKRFSWEREVFFGDISRQVVVCRWCGHGRLCLTLGVATQDGRDMAVGWVTATVEFFSRCFHSRNS